MKKTIKGTISLFTALLAAAGSLVISAPHAQAACNAGSYWTDYAPGNSETWTIGWNSTCADLNAAYTQTRYDGIRGWYFTRSTGVWTAGKLGFVGVDTLDDGWQPLLLNVKSDTIVRGEGLNYSQYVRYVY